MPFGGKSIPTQTFGVADARRDIREYKMRCRGRGSQMKERRRKCMNDCNHDE
jgi:hypothetical protein